MKETCYIRGRLVILIIKFIVCNVSGDGFWLHLNNFDVCDVRVLDVCIKHEEVNPKALDFINELKILNYDNPN